MFPRVLSRQPGAVVTRYDDDTVTKKGRRVKPNEEVTLRLVQQFTDVPVPTVYSSWYEGEVGNICMSWIEGETLDNIWDYLEDDKLKERVCRHTWELIYRLRAIPKPAQLESHFQCSADGTPSRDVLIDPAHGEDSSPLSSELDLRQRIYERYLHFHGRRYEGQLLDMLPKSEKTVFTHGDIAPRNLMVANDFENPVCAIIDWEKSGWYPEYWEYANVLKPSVDEDWQKWMDYTAPEKWDISGIVAARRVLF